MTLMSYKLEPVIWSRDTGQWITWFGRCQLIITWCHMSKKYTVNQGCISLSTYYLKYGHHLARLHWHHRRGHAFMSTSNTASHVTMRKTLHGFPLILCMVMGLCLAAVWVAGVPLWWIWFNADNMVIIIDPFSHCGEWGHNNMVHVFALN